MLHLRAKLLVSGLLMFAVTAFVSAQCPQLVWADEFNGSALDLTKWTPQIGNGCDIGLCGWGNNELQYYTDRSTNLSVSGGFLTITARKERIQNNQYTSARIRTLNKGEWTYGRMEARMKLPIGKGIWPAFWMLPTDEVYGGWPQSGEIDIMEYLGHQPSTVYGTIHYGQPYPNNRSTGGQYLLPEGRFNDDFHVFAIEWEPNVIRWYVDGILYVTKTNADVSPERWPFDQRFHFLLNVAVGGNWPGNPDATTVFPQTLTVDYVRVYASGFPNITGPDQVQANATGVQYSVPSSPGASYNWSVPAGAVIRSGQGSNTITADWGSSSGQVRVQIAQSCGSNEYSKNVYIKPTLTYESTFENFDDKRNLTYLSSTGTYQAPVANPEPSGVNTSANVAHYVRNSAEQYDVLVYAVSTITDASQFSTRAKKFLMDVHSTAPANTLIFIQLENSATATASNFPTGRHSRYVAYTSAQNDWGRLEFELDAILDSSVPNNSVDRIIILFNSNSLTGHTYYFDNFDAYAVGTGGGGDTQPPTAPANLTSPGRTDVTVSLAWNASTDNVGVTAYDIFRDGNPAGSSTTTSFTVTGLSPATTYNFTVKARDAAGNVSAASNALSVTTDPPAPLHIEAENYNGMKGVTTVSCSDTGGGLNVASIDNRDYVEYTVNIPLAGTYRVDFRVASGVSTGRFDFKRGPTVLASVTVPNTGGNQVWQTVSTNVSLNAGSQTLRVSCTATGFSLNWLKLTLQPSEMTSAESSAGRVSVYPNPSRGSVIIELTGSEMIRELIVYSPTGIVRHAYPRAPKAVIETAGMKPGLYVLKISAESFFEIRKLLVED